MTDQRPPPPSPCIDVCRLNDKGLCLGCYRTGEEIMLWSRLGANSQWAVVERCRQREAAVKKP